MIALPNVAVHASVLPTGKVLIWGRRMVGNPDVDVRECTPFVWDPQTRQAVDTQQPESPTGQKVNLFCSGHCFLPDGTLLVVGGHKTDGDGLDQASVYDPVANTWTPGPAMNHGRWYPSAVTLPDGRALVAGGSYQETENSGAIPNFEPQIWQDGGWVPSAGLPNQASFPLYPRLQVTSDATLTMSGQLAQTWTLTTTGNPTWTVTGEREMRDRDYCPAVSYAPGKLIYLGGGTNADTGRPTSVAEVIDVRAPGAAWQRTNPMAFPRRQHNATLLADGTVLITGGTRGVGFNDLGPGEPVHQAEIWDPVSGTWTTVAAEQADRCYHATTVLLPDGTVLSGGGGEFRVEGNPDNANDPADSHSTAQIYRPPYLFRGQQPQLLAAPAVADYGQAFDVDTDQLNQIVQVNWIRLSTVTHSANMGQLIVSSTPEVVAGRLRVTAPAGPGDAPPGHYILFLVNNAGVPSVGSIVQLNVPAPALPPQPLPLLEIGLSPPVADEDRGVADRLATEAAAGQTGTKVVVGVTGLCPYGIGACWGGAHEGLRQLDRVAHVVPVPDAEHSTATVYLVDQGVPQLARWREQFAQFVNGSYRLRGVEVTLSGRVVPSDGRLELRLEGPGSPSTVLAKTGSDRRPDPTGSGTNRATAVGAGRGSGVRRTACAASGPSDRVGMDADRHSDHGGRGTDPRRTPHSP